MPYLFSSKAAPVHNMLSEQTLGLVDYHVQHALNASTCIGFIDGKVNVQYNSNTILAFGQS